MTNPENRKSFTASLALPKMLTLSKIGTSSILHSLNRIIENAKIPLCGNNKQ